MKLAASAFGLALVVLSTGCPMLEVSAEVPEACMVQRDIAVDGAPVEDANHIDMSFTFDDLSGFDQLREYDAKLHFTKATITAKSGVSDLAFISAATVDVASGDADSTLPTRTFYSCSAGNCPSKSKSLDVPVSDSTDIVEYIDTGSLAISINAIGNMPASGWTMDAELCVEGSASYSK